MSDLSIFYLELGILAISARLMGELARRLFLPAVVGELSVGVIFGPTILKRLFPDLQATIFPAAGDTHVALTAVLTLAIAFFLVAAGMEVDLRLVRRGGHLAWPISLSGVAVPFLCAFLPAYFFPSVFGLNSLGERLVAALFMGAACSITSLPIIGRILIDLDLFKTTFAMLIMSCAVLDDFMGWIVIGIAFALNNRQAPGAFGGQKIELMIIGAVAFVITLLTVGRFLLKHVIAAIYKFSSEPGRVLGFILAIGLLAASYTAAIGIHGLFGAFIAGVAIGSTGVKDETRHSVEEFANSFLAPVYFAAVGLSVDFIANFSWQTTLVILVIASLGKITGCFFAARFKKIPQRVSFAIGLAMNSRGSLEIIVATMGLQAHIIDGHIFVGLTVMAVTTSCIAGWTLRRLAGSLAADDLLVV
jgi:Kef-type K+ transport system membrane component KefB